ncbi:Drug resistance transporter, Bcr/CflA subfamily [Alloalcanivorax dieselolei B5]|uniref:Bcr/CflA family efflux transporter n=1 Tax=Alcanivorax dieselolei (strain DSM 16502 / CGMCC 1.3690 / MCCC 1A00001 / B-5) TaxID=930169 RepID=K0CEB8_ALCDB|nr:multidrug effflux MFS transporter [Alloalcanivorax dieselolei]AFT70670.1 Drug resistance transporter, Bcr/CflA subfamily [Alloalcanivorax dieselolei B5]GGJ86093.1 Bcr/CflA family drug resistance efflux transporter [Alloalcanivorax dieselolei]
MTGPISERGDASGLALETTREFGGNLLILLAGLAAIGTLSTNIILPSFTSMATDIGVPARELGLLLSSFFAAFAIGQLLVGPLSDRYGRRPLVVLGLAVFIAGSLWCSRADDINELILGRVIQALGVCAASVLSRAIARDLFDGEVLTRALALTMVAMAAAPGFSPLLGGALEQALGWRANFLMVAVLGAALIPLYLSGAGETLPPSRRSRKALATAAPGYLRLLLDPRFLLPALAVSLVIGGLYSFFAAAPAILMGHLGLSALQLGWFFAATVFVVFAAGLLAPRFARRFGVVKVGLAGILIALIGGLTLLPASAEGLIPFSLAITVFLFGMGLINPLGTALTLHPFPDRAGLASALLGCLQMSCAAAMTALVSALPLPPVTALGAILATVSALALAAFLLYRSRGNNG